MISLILIFGFLCQPSKRQRNKVHRCATPDCTSITSPGKIQKFPLKRTFGGEGNFDILPPYLLAGWPSLAINSHHLISSLQQWKKALHWKTTYVSEMKRLGWFSSGRKQFMQNGERRIYLWSGDTTLTSSCFLLAARVGGMIPVIERIFSRSSSSVTPITQDNFCSINATQDHAI